MTIARILKHTLTVALAILTLLGALFVYFFFIDARSGASAEGQRLSQIESSPNYNDDLRSIDEIEADVIDKRMSYFDGNALKAAESLGLSRSAFYRRLEKLKE